MDEASKPDLTALVTFYAAEKGGRKVPPISGYQCVCMASIAHPLSGWSARMLFEGEAICPGEQRLVSFAFLMPEAVGIFRDARQFFVWEGRIIGEAMVC